VALGLVVAAPTAATAAEPQLRVGVGTADITPPPFDPQHDEPEFALPNCVPGMTGTRLFRFEEPYTDQNGNGRFDYPEPFCDANQSGGYDGIYLSGAADSLAKRVRDPIDARAIAFRASGQTYELISIVTQGTFENYIKTIREEIMKQRPVANVIVSSNHNEASPDTVGIYGGGENPIGTGSRTGIDEYYMHKWLIPQVVKAGVQAYDDLRPATLWARQAGPPSNISVRTHTFPTVDDKGNDVAIDPKFRVLQARDEAGKAIFTMLNLAAHNQQYGQHGDHTAISGDWPGEFQRRLEAKGGMGMGLFLVGDTGSEEDPHVEGVTDRDCSGLADCEKFITTVGQAVADHVAGEVAKLRRIPSGGLAFDRKTLYVPIENNAFKAAAGAGLFGERHTFAPDGTDTGRAGPDVRTHVSVLRIGPQLQFIANPGEAFPALMVGSPWGIDDAECPNREEPPVPTWRAQAAYRFQVGLADDLIGYELPAWAWKSDTPGVFTTDACDSEASKHSHSLETEGVGPTGSNAVAKALTGLLSHPDYADPTFKRVWLGRYVQRDGKLTRRPEGAVAVWLAPAGSHELKAGAGTVIGTAGITGFGTRSINKSGRMMDYDGIDQAAADVTTRGMVRFACNGTVAERYYVDVYPALSTPDKLPAATTGKVSTGCGTGHGGTGTPGNPHHPPPPGHGGGGKPACYDRIHPTVGVTGGTFRLERDRIFMRGHAHDRGCRHRVAAVLVSIARKAHHRCRFVQPNGRLSKGRRCHRPVLLRAAGTSNWSLALAAHLTPGHYRVVVRALDMAGNREHRTRNNHFTRVLR
jgi:hypothetical protein